MIATPTTTGNRHVPTRYGRAGRFRALTRLTMIGLAMVVSLVMTACGGDSNGRTITIEFTTNPHQSSGSRLVVDGASVGRVTSVKMLTRGGAPRDTFYQVTATIDRSTKLPADVKAVAVTGDKNPFIELTPAYSGGGPELADEATIPLHHTLVD